LTGRISVDEQVQHIATVVEVDGKNIKSALNLGASVSMQVSVAFVDLPVLIYLRTSSIPILLLFMEVLLLVYSANPKTLSLLF
jgi:hypothetical protein